MREALDTTRMRLTSGQKAWLAVGIAQKHELPISTGITLADTIAELLPELPRDEIRRCHCGTPIGITQYWCSTRCHLEDEGRERELDEAV